jgi:CheY-like chemotaxis protein
MGMENTTLRGIKILIVEDDQSSRLYLNKVLEKTGALLINANDGSQAVNRVLSDPGIRVILMDLQLPVLDGYAAAKQIRESNPDIKIIAQTAYGLPGDMEMLAESGFDDFIIKPIFAQQLIDKIEKQILL